MSIGKTQKELNNQIMKNFTLGIILVFLAFSLTAQYVTVTGDELDWNDPDTWVSGQVPNPGPGGAQNLRTITISPGSSVILDGDLTFLANLELFVAGSLSINNLKGNNNLQVEVAQGGVFTVKGDISYRNNTRIIVDGLLFADSILVTTGGSNATGCIGGNGSLLSNEDDGTAPWVSDNIVIPCPGMDNPFPVIALLDPGISYASTTENLSLYWATFREDNSSFFTVQRSKDNQKWLPVGNVLEAAGQSASYEFLDPFPLEGKSWYRLKLTDLDGKFSFSEDILEVDWTAEDLNFKVMKDPFSWTIRFPVSGEYIVEAYTPHGRRILMDRAEQTLSMPAPDGAVVFRVTNNKQRTISRLVM